MDPELSAKLTKLFFNVEPPSLEEHSQIPPQEPEPAILWAEVFPELIPPEKEGINNNNNNENENEENEEEEEEEENNEENEDLELGPGEGNIKKSWSDSEDQVPEYDIQDYY